MSEDDGSTVFDAVLGAASGERWFLERDESGATQVRVQYADGHVESRRVTRERRPAAPADVEFIANCRGDLERLLAAHRGRATPSGRELDEIERRCVATSPAPWRVFLESDGGLGGCNVIVVSDDDEEPDLYLWRDADPAPDGDVELVALARNEIPGLVARVRRSRT